MKLLALGQLKSSRDNRYYAAFVDHKDGLKITIPRTKRKHAPIVFLNFVTRIGCWPKILYSDVADEFISRVFKTMFLAQGCNHIIVPKGDHHANGKSESAVAEIDEMTRVTVHDATLPLTYDTLWCVMTLVDSMTTYVTDDPSKTIF